MNTTVEFRDYVTNASIPGWEDVDLRVLPSVDELVKLGDQAYRVQATKHVIKPPYHKIIIVLAPYDYWVD